MLKIEISSKGKEILGDEDLSCRSYFTLLLSFYSDIKV